MSHLIAVYDCAQAYGGPEEGGWWYDTGALVRVVKVFDSEDKAIGYCQRLNRRLSSRITGPNKGKHDYNSTLSEGLIEAQVHDNIAPQGFPEVRPHYE